MTGRFAPSPTGDLHLGNLRTAAVAWLSARSRGDRFLVRMEDLDRHQSSRAIEDSQLRDLAAIGIDWDGEVVRQSDRFELYDAAIDELTSRGLVYECFCTRREIADEIAAAPSAPHGPPGSYPGTCRELNDRDRADRLAEGRPPALRLRGGDRIIEFVDDLVGPVEGAVDDVVLRRNDGVPAYNLAVVVDDDAQGVSEIIRGDGLLMSTPRQIHLQELLGIARPRYLHVPLVVDVDGNRLAKRNGLPLTVTELAATGVSAESVISWIATSLGFALPSEKITLGELRTRFDPSSIPLSTCPVARFGSDDT